jgi:DNA-directed RNA polymerase subunit RPC12/RpoP
VGGAPTGEGCEGTGDIITDDRRCVRCGAHVESFEGDPVGQCSGCGGFVLALSVTYTLKPCGHVFRKETAA